MSPLRVGLTGIRGHRPRHQALAFEPQPQAWPQLCHNVITALHAVINKCFLGDTYVPASKNKDMDCPHPFFLTRLDPSPPPAIPLGRTGWRRTWKHDLMGKCVIPVCCVLISGGRLEEHSVSSSLDSSPPPTTPRPVAAPLVRLAAGVCWMYWENKPKDLPGLFPCNRAKAANMLWHHQIHNQVLI